MGCRRRDHPRTCGEHVTGRPLILSAVGSSPRLRRTPYLPRHLRGGRGIIPTLAGNTNCRRPALSRCRNHPRACREHGDDGKYTVTLLGSSPRLRGTRWTAARRSSPSGIIPALAGNTGAAGMDCLGCRDHPRACGEHAMLVEMPDSQLGSSPRLRGTPARYWPWPRSQRDHPRACGEHSAVVAHVSRIHGSSPRLRGTH